MQTNMGGSSAAITVDQSAGGIATVFDIATALQTNAKASFPAAYNAYHERLSSNPLAYVVYNGDLLNW